MLNLAAYEALRGHVIAIGCMGHPADACYTGPMLMISQRTNAVIQMTLPTSQPNKKTNLSRVLKRWRSIAPALLGVVTLIGCASQTKSNLQFDQIAETPCQSFLQQIETPDLQCETCTTGDELLTSVPLTISNYQDTASWDLTIDQCVEMALANSKVMQKLGGVVVSAPQGVNTLYDQAIQETGLGSVEDALADFDAQLSSSFTYNRSEREFNNLFFGGGTPRLTSNTSNFSTELSKQTAAGTSFSMSSTTLYDRNSSPANLFGSSYDVLNLLEVRQPLLRGSGTAVNRIAGPNAVPGQYDGVLIRRIRSDISLADFEISVRDLVRDVERAYWELYFAYRDLDTKIAARESSRETWENRKLRFDNGLGRPDDEAQARQQYYSFKGQAQNALTGTSTGQVGVYSTERNLRRLLGIAAADGRLIRPATEPVLAPVAFDWNQSQTSALQTRVELRRQKWAISQRELELLAAKQLNKWRLDVVGQYGFRGFGDNLFGSRDRNNGSAISELLEGNLDDWSVGVELGGAIGNRAGHLAIRSAELSLARERSVLKEQQRQILHDLNAAYTEVDRAMEVMKTNFNARIAAFDELEPKRKRVEEGQDQVFFLLDAQSRTATAESAVHRAVADYNQALLNYTYTAGDLLSHYNIRLTEGPWDSYSNDRAYEKAQRQKNQPAAGSLNDLPAVSAGAHLQQ
jgi:outer membrane protein TolC